MHEHREDYNFTFNLWNMKQYGRWRDDDDTDKCAVKWKCEMAAELLKSSQRLFHEQWEKFHHEVAIY